MKAYRVSIGLYPGILIGIRTYEQEDVQERRKHLDRALLRKPHDMHDQPFRKLVQHKYNQRHDRDGFKGPAHTRL